ncbi:MBL fold metallo-hydrolase [Amycolatopsis endophytica]|uniref:Glyoxylase-like metal-dependent hydrolase (Beta-lactamase superfamily II) n=1 Tax=Amycolatopsis endophytica TaxID=860233 RepID=A0A853BFA2_9PSEU|nr:MBL fold metallo-hydrolase [Amycolatopsis endophytica]NYI93257.1 glyoxylase-like metal-dependent hydrolase (beta-lactamase superfamily II) [Amycolatopsis endophytica]
MERLRRPALLRSLHLGDTKVTHLPDGAVQLDPLAWFPGTTAETWAGYLDETGHFVASIGGLLVEHGDRALLIDAGFGPRSAPPGDIHGPIQGGTMLGNLGRPPSDVEAVAYTHLHEDHIGWVAHPGGEPAFAHAEHLLAAAEWAQRDLAGAAAAEALRPRVRTVTDGEEIFPGVRALFAAGHTAGHTAYVISGGGRRLIAFGDAIHSPVQIGHPEWRCAVDFDPAQAVEFRHRLVSELAEPDTIGFGIHLADVVFGRVDTSGGQASWIPVDD